MTEQLYDAADRLPDEVFEKIKKVLALTTSSNPGERANALAMAQALLAKYNLDISAVQAHSAAGDLAKQVTDQTYVFEPKGYSKALGRDIHRTRADLPWVTKVANAVARGCFCRVMIRTYEVWFIGRTLNVRSAMYMFGSVVEQLESMASKATSARTKALKAEYDLSNAARDLRGLSSPKVFRNSWLIGAAETVEGRLREQREAFDKEHRTVAPTAGQAAREMTGKEVAVVMTDEIADYMEEKYGYYNPRKHAHEVYVDKRTPEQIAKDEAAWAEAARKAREREAKLDEAYRRRYGRDRSQAHAHKGPKISYSGYSQGQKDGHRVSLDAGKVQSGERKQLKKGGEQ